MYNGFEKMIADGTLSERVDKWNEEEVKRRGLTQVNSSIQSAFTFNSN